MATLNSPVNASSIPPANSIGNNQLKNNSLTLNGNDGISAGSVSLGGSLALGISGILKLDDNLQAANGDTIWDDGNNYIPISVFEANNIGGTASNGLSISGAKLGNDISIGISGLLSLDSGLESSAGTTIWDSNNDYLPLTALEAKNIGGTGSNGISVSGADLGSSISVGISGNLQLDSDLESPGGTTIWDNGSSYIPDGVLQSSGFLGSVTKATNYINWKDSGANTVMQLNINSGSGNSGDLTIEGEFTEGAAI